MKSIIGKDTNNSNKSRTFCINGKSTTNISKIVNELNNFFVSVGVDLAKNIKCSVNPLSYVNTLNNPSYSCDVTDFGRMHFGHYTNPTM